MKSKYYTVVVPFLIAVASYSDVGAQDSFNSVAQQLQGLPGKSAYRETPFVAAGNRVYMVGYQNGSFPDLGWHITGEMGGIWDHPIKLMDGFSAEIIAKNSGNSRCLNAADQFVNYPIGNSHRFDWNAEGITIERFQFVPDDTEGLIVEYKIINNSVGDKELQFLFTGHVDLRPTWLSERTNTNDADDEINYDKGVSAVIGRDSKNNWYTAFGSSIEADHFKPGAGSCKTGGAGRGKDGVLTYSLTIKGNGGVAYIPFFIAGSFTDEKSLRSTFDLLKKNGMNKLKEKITRYKELGNTSRLVIPEKHISQMYEWLKYNTDWLVREVPGQGKGLSAGLPDYPWWFGCDNAYALQGVLATGNHQVAKNTITLLTDISKRTNNNGRIIHEVSTNGEVFNPGNVNETAQFIHLVWVYYTWTGDRTFVSELYPFLQEGIAWLKEMDIDKNQYPNGSGMMEIHGLDSEMIDVVVYTQQALSSIANLAAELNDATSSAEYRKQADQLKKKINEEWWSQSSGSFADFRSTDAAALPIIEAAIVRADTLHKEWSVTELKERRSKLNTKDTGKNNAQVVYHNWVVNTPLETGIADDEKGRIALQTNRKYENAFGVYVTGLDRSSEPDSVVLASRKKVFSYTGAVMTLPTGLQAIAAANYGSPDMALEYINKLYNSFSYVLPGSMYEVSPDFGMFTQAWNIYGVSVSLIQKIFGVEPLAHKQSVILRPQLPSKWNEASLENLKVGENTLSFSVKKEGNRTEYKITQNQPTWKIAMAMKGNPKKVILNGKRVDPKSYTGKDLNLTGGENTIQVTY